MVCTEAASIFDANEYNLESSFFPEAKHLSHFLVWS